MIVGLRWYARAALLVAAFVGHSSAVTAQMQLPGALGGGGSGARTGGGSSGGGAGGAPPYAPPKPVAIDAPSEAAIAGRVLNRNGTKGEMTFDKAGEGLALSKLTLVGTKISKPGQVCTVNVALDTPLSLNASGRPAGAIRYSVPLPACSFGIDILDGAALVTRREATCDFVQADCRVSPEGLWGPRAVDITPKRAKDLERERLHWETTLLANYHALLKKAGKDKLAIKSVAKEQAAFSSEREMTCRDYDQETVHGFCSTQVTEARALALMAQFGPFSATPSRKHAPRPKPKAATAAETLPGERPQ